MNDPLPLSNPQPTSLNTHASDSQQMLGQHIRRHATSVQSENIGTNVNKHGNALGLSTVDGKVQRRAELHVLAVEHVDDAVTLTLSVTVAGSRRGQFGDDVGVEAEFEKLGQRVAVFELGWHDVRLQCGSSYKEGQDSSFLNQTS